MSSAWAVLLWEINFVFEGEARRASLLRRSWNLKHSGASKEPWHQFPCRLGGSEDPASPCRDSADPAGSQPCQHPTLVTAALSSPAAGAPAGTHLAPCRDEPHPAKATGAAKLGYTLPRNILLLFYFFFFLCFVERFHVCSHALV